MGRCRGLRRGRGSSRLHSRLGSGSVGRGREGGGGGGGGWWASFCCRGRWEGYEGGVEVWVGLLDVDLFGLLSWRGLGYSERVREGICLTLIYSRNCPGPDRKKRPLRKSRVDPSHVGQRLKYCRPGFIYPPGPHGPAFELCRRTVRTRTLAEWYRGSI